MLSKRFLAQRLYADAWLESVEETVMERPDGGSGDSCIVSTLLIRFPQGGPPPRTLVAKRVTGPSQRHCDFDSLKTEIKRLSYKVEGEFLHSIARLAPLNLFAMAHACFWLDESSHTSVLIEDHLPSLGFPRNTGELTEAQLLASVDWLIAFHDNFSTMRLLPAPAARVWVRGGYWALDKRSEEKCKLISRWEEERNYHSFLSQFPLNFGIRLVRCSGVVDRVLFPGFPPLAFSLEEEMRMYGNREESEREDRRREEVRIALSSRVVERMVTFLHRPPQQETIGGGGGHECKFLSPVLVHGDFKGENIFFSPAKPKAAVCDFQWAGFGLGVLDLVSLVFSSMPLDHPRPDALISALLDRYAAGAHKRDRSILEYVFNWAVVDYARYVLGCGQVFPEDVFLLTKAHSILTSIDKGNVLDNYDDILHVHF